MDATVQRSSIKVWDPLVRLGHWALVVAFAMAYFSAEDEGDAGRLHVWSGYAVGLIVALRVLWGFIGSRHARFGDFVFGPIAAIRYLGDLLRGHARRYLGHSPAGAIMVFALLISLGGTVGTGLIAYGKADQGPLASAGSLVMRQAYAEDSDGDGDSKAESAERSEQSGIGGLHAMFANLTLGLVILHILGMGWASLVHRENLALAMVTGQKRPLDGG